MVAVTTSEKMLNKKATKCTLSHGVPKLHTPIKLVKVRRVHESWMESRRQNKHSKAKTLPKLQDIIGYLTENGGMDPTTKCEHTQDTQKKTDLTNKHKGKKTGERTTQHDSGKQNEGTDSPVELQTQRRAARELEPWSAFIRKMLVSFGWRAPSCLTPQGAPQKGIYRYTQ